MQPPTSNHSATSSLSNCNTPNNSIEKSTSLSSYDHSLVQSNLTLPLQEQTSAAAAAAA
ncbi:unnamed protein product, partial [Rotaria magnacalcarata]